MMNASRRNYWPDSDIINPSSRLAIAVSGDPHALGQTSSPWDLDGRR
jgi:hypothetical protein